MSWYKKSQNRKEIPPVTILMYNQSVGELKVEGMPEQYYYGVSPFIYRQLSNFARFQTSWANGKIRSMLTNLKNNKKKQDDPQMKLF